MTSLKPQKYRWSSTPGDSHGSSVIGTAATLTRSMSLDDHQIDSVERGYGEISHAAQNRRRSGNLREQPMPHGDGLTSSECHPSAARCENLLANVFCSRDVHPLLYLALVSSGPTEFVRGVCLGRLLFGLLCDFCFGRDHPSSLSLRRPSGRRRLGRLPTLDDDGRRLKMRFKFRNFTLIS